MNHSTRQGCLLILFLLYGLFFYFVFSTHQKLDFFSFYSSLHASLQANNPYKNFYTDYLPTVTILPANLNPPFALWLFSFLGYFSYTSALMIWAIFSFILGISGAIIVFYYAFSFKFLQKNATYLILIYFAFFPTVLNVIFQQFGAILLFFLMAGYYFYQNHRHYLAGIVWGIIIAIKLFPALLFFLVLKQARFKVFTVMLLTLVLACLIPMWVYGPIIYKYYFTLLSDVLWYGDNWNASLYGILFRLFSDPNHIKYSLVINALYIFLSFILLLWYWKKLSPDKNDLKNHQPFCFTLTMMLLISPLGWAYYFPLLLIPLVLTWFAAAEKMEYSMKAMLLWLFSFFLINMPMDYVHMEDMSHYFVRITFYSCYFYGLLILTYIVAINQKIYGRNELEFIEGNNFFTPVLGIILLFGLSVPAVSFIARMGMLGMP